MWIFNLILLNLLLWNISLRASFPDLIAMVPQPNNKAQHTLYFQNPKSNDILSPEFLKTIIACFNVDIFIETGTYNGDSTQNAASLFKEIHTIELSNHLFEQASRRFQTYPTIKTYCGDSAHVLPQILPNIQGRILFWLDGHYSEGCTARGDRNTPILQELMAIKNANITNAIIVIDDIRLFRVPLKQNLPYALVGYPPLELVMKMLYEINNNYRCIILADALLAFPADPAVTVSPTAYACMIYRLSNYASANQKTQAKLLIKNATAQEKYDIQAVYSRFYHDQEHGFNEFYTQWYELITKP